MYVLSHILLEFDYKFINFDYKLKRNKKIILDRYFVFFISIAFLALTKDETTSLSLFK